MAKYTFTRGDRYAITLPVTKDGVAFDLTTWTATCTLGQDDVAKAVTEVESVDRCTLTVQPTATGATVTICNSALLEPGDYVLELRATNGSLVYTWPTWDITIAEPQGI